VGPVNLIGLICVNISVVRVEDVNHVTVT